MRINTYATKLVRTGHADYSRPTPIKSQEIATKHCGQLFAPILQDCPQEQFWIVTLDTKLKIIGLHHITTGTLDCSLVHPREVFRAALLDSSAAILCVHNHPSGDTTPSRQDYEITKRLKEVGEIMGISVVDHIVLGWNELGELSSASCI
jgi:DNA repair protein RadC